MKNEEIAMEVAKALDEKKGEDIRIYDVRGISGVTDFYVVVTGAAAPHLKGLIAETQRRMKTLGVQSFRTSGDPESGWIAVDYFHVVVHAFSPEARRYYAIEGLWSAAKTLPYQPML